MSLILIYAAPASCECENAFLYSRIPVLTLVRTSSYLEVPATPVALIHHLVTNIIIHRSYPAFGYHNIYIIQQSSNISQYE